MAKTTKAYKHRNQINGKIIGWNDEKGFGFIEMVNGETIFFHISEFNPPFPPRLGEQVVFFVEDNQRSDGKLQATNVETLAYIKQQAITQQQLEKQSQSSTFKSNQRMKLAIAVLFHLALVLLIWKQMIPYLVLVWYVLLAGLTFAIYAKDKHSAKTGGWRAPENSLHLLAIIGGWVGAMLAQTLLRHKSKKPSFRMGYYLTVLLNIAALMGLIYLMNPTFFHNYDITSQTDAIRILFL